MRLMIVVLSGMIGTKQIVLLIAALAELAE
jgi:hypothetical protein